jgi:tyrosinase
MFQTPQNNSISHFSIGGIHGLPYVEWEGAGGANPVKGSQWGGYCTHGCVLFPTWHRPYVALYEVSSLSYAFRTFMLISIILSSKCCSRTLSRLQTRTRWIHRVGLPQPRTCERHTGTGRLTLSLLLKLSPMQTLDIITPDGQTTTVANPLIQYTFNPIDPSFPAPYSSWQTTIRHPDDPNSPDATTDVQALKRKASLFRLTYTHS